MSSLTLKDLLATKEEGDVWYSYQAPEQFHMWTSKYPWTIGAFREYGLALLSIRVRGSLLISETVNNRFSAKSPLRLDCGIQISSGYEKVTQNREASYYFRTADVAEVAEGLSEISKKTGIHAWEITGLSVYNSKKGAELKYSRHNPNGTGRSLYLYRVETDGKSRLYPDVSIHEMQHLIGNFQGNSVHCTVRNCPVIDCGVKHKKEAKPTQIKLRKKQ